MVIINNLPPPAEGVRHQQPCTSVFINKKEMGKGTIYIAESRLSWMDDCSGAGFSIEYPHISIHAISRDLEAFPEECLYVMLDTAIEEPENDSEKEEEPLDFTEVRFIPDDKEKLDEMYNAMIHCQSLHPDPQQSVSEEEGSEGDDDFEDGPKGLNGMRNLEMEVDGQFEDAEYD